MGESDHARVERIREDDRVVLVVRGRLDHDSAPAVLDWIHTWLPANSPVGLDLSEVEALDSAGVAVLAESQAIARERGTDLRLTRVSEAASRTLGLFRFQDAVSAVEAPGSNLEQLGEQLYNATRSLNRLFLLMADTFYWALLGPVAPNRGAPAGELTRQTILLGSRAFGIVALLATLIGVTLALLSAYQLRQFGANIYAANLVAIAMVREMGPMMTAIIVAGRSGSAIAAEMATMEVTEEVDALRAMGFSPIRFLVVPKLYAITFAQPLLTVIAMAFGILGGMFVASVSLGVPPQAYLYQAGSVLTVGDVATGLFKSLVFGWIILIVGAHAGLGTRGGASEVGTSTTQSVVWSIFSVIIADCVFSLIFYL